MYSWLVFAHVLGVFGFLLAHGAAAAVSFKLRGEREVERVRVLIELCTGARMIANVSLLVLLAAGIAAGYMGGWWGRYWIWSALGLLILMGVAMTAAGSRSFEHIRELVEPSSPRRREKTASVRSAPGVSPDQQLADALAAVHPWWLTFIGGGGLALILWLMIFKPF